MEASGSDAEQRAGRVLAVAAIYGANASGKSNVLAALRFMRDAVLQSYRIWSPDGGVPRDPFAWGAHAGESSLYEVSFLAEGVRYDYGFVVDDERVLEEWLHASPMGRKQTWFEREGNDFKFGEHLRGENRAVERLTRTNALFLSTAVQAGHEQLERIFRWFRTMHTHAVLAAPGTYSFRLAMDEDVPSLTIGQQRHLFDTLNDAASSEHMARFRELLRAADVGILDFKLQKPEDEELGARGRRRARFRILLQHRSNDRDRWLSLDEESHGTQQLFRLAPLILHVLRKGGVLVIDELEASFHPLLALHIVRTFNDPAKNPKNAQLIFSTHDTNLLGTTLGEPSLRREQVWLTERDDEGVTKLYPLTDFKPRKAENLERGYLQGRYGAIPFLGELADVATAAKKEP
ncbi:ATP/GTP-binding protein [Pendulispora albinea]|uniref:ATP-binding protein n=1 Tax=Pendulispora albinea TaxID=2741071 RepID=A0ABZ2LMF0_9BACT